MSKFIVDFCEDDDNEPMMFETLEEAKQYAEDNLTHSRQNVYIIKDGAGVSMLHWHTIPPTPNDVVTKKFGWGFYGAWTR